MLISNHPVAICLPLTETSLRCICCEKIACLAINAAKLQMLQKQLYHRNRATAAANVKHEAIANLFLAHVELN